MILFNLIFDPVPVVDGLGLTSLMYTLNDPVPQVVGGGGGGGGGGDNTEPPESTNIDISIGINPSGPLPEVLALSFTRASLINYNAKASVTVELTPRPRASIETIQALPLPQPGRAEAPFDLTAVLMQ